MSALIHEQHEQDELTAALTWLDRGHHVALATVVDTWGSSPRPRGSQLAVRDDGLFIGSVSGGCVEGRVVEAALACMRDGQPRTLEFGVSNNEAWEVGLACGGTIRIYVVPVAAAPSSEHSPLSREVLEAVYAARAELRAIVWLTPLDGSAARTYVLGDPDRLSPELQATAARALATDETQNVPTTAGTILVQPFNPALELIIVGAVHIAEPLARIAQILGFAVTIIDPRDAFAHTERWPGVQILADYPDEVLHTKRIAHRTAIVALTHDPKIDDPALEAALRSPAFYIGALGSQKTHASRLRRLHQRGFSQQDLTRIHGPIGLKIGARSPAEIAVAISAQITEVLHAAAGVAS